MELHIRLPAITKEDLAIDELSERSDKSVDASINRKLRSRVFYEQINRGRQLPYVRRLVFR